MAADPTKIFGDDPKNYDQMRFSYPKELASQLLEEYCAATGMHPASVRVTDIGAGTGGLGSVFANLGCRVNFVEPNARSVEYMKEKFHPAISSGLAGVYQGSADETGLAESSTDLLVFGDSAHWIDAGALKEFKRIGTASTSTMVFSRFWSQEAPQTHAIHQLLQGYEQYQTSPNQFVRDADNLRVRYGKHLVCENGAQHLSYVSLQRYSPEELLNYFRSISSTTDAIKEDAAGFNQTVISPFLEWSKEQGYVDKEGNVRVPYEVAVHYGPVRSTRIDKDLFKGRPVIERF